MDHDPATRADVEALYQQALVEIGMLQMENRRLAERIAMEHRRIELLTADNYEMARKLQAQT